MSLVLIIAVIFSSLFFFLLTKYFKLEKYQLLYNNAVNASNIVVENYNSNMKMFVNVDYIMARYNVINSSIDADVFLTNSKGEIEIYQNNKFYNKKFTVPAEIMNIVFQKGIYQVKGNTILLVTNKMIAVEINITTIKLIIKILAIFPKSLSTSFDEVATKTAPLKS